MRFNQITIAGRLTRDGELKYAPSGVQILNLRLAFDQGTKEQKETGYIDVVIFRDRAEKLAPYCLKARELLVAGRLQYREWNDNNSGQKRSAMELVAFEVEFVGPPPGERQDAPQQGQQAQGPSEGDFNRPATGWGPPPAGRF